MTHTPSSSPRTAPGLRDVSGILLLAIMAIVLFYCVGCASSTVYIPHGATNVTVNVVQIWGWRSAQAGSSTNVWNTIEGGGKPELTIPLVK